MIVGLVGAIVGYVVVTAGHMGVMFVTAGHTGVIVGRLGVIVGCSGHRLAAWLALSGLLRGRFGRAYFPGLGQARCHPSPSLHAMERI